MLFMVASFLSNQIEWKIDSNRELLVISKFFLKAPHKMTLTFQLLVMSLCLQTIYLAHRTLCGLITGVVQVEVLNIARFMPREFCYSNDWCKFYIFQSMETVEILKKNFRTYFCMGIYLLLHCTSLHLQTEWLLKIVVCVLKIVFLSGVYVYWSPLCDARGNIKGLMAEFEGFTLWYGSSVGFWVIITKNLHEIHITQ